MNIRDFAENIHKTCDDAPYGGGPGMVMKIEPIYKAMEHVEKTMGKTKVYLAYTTGDGFSMRIQQYGYQKYPHICLICGRYEGLDERVLTFIDEEISVGDYVLSGGEIPALSPHRCDHPMYSRGAWQ